MKIDCVFDPALDYHLELLNRRKENQSYYKLGSEKEALKTYGTVRLDVGRQFGKTFYISRNATEDDVVIVKDVYRRAIMKEQCSVYKHNSNCDRIYTRDFKVETIELVRNVWIDDASSISQLELDNLYSIFAGICEYFILIG